MELFLNSAWAFVAFVSLCLWLRFEKREKRQRWLPFVALAMLLVLLFPVISVSDDLWAMQNPAEVDSAVRRDHVPGAHYAHFPAVALPEAAFSGVALVADRSIAPSFHHAPPAQSPFAHAIQSRPPPAA
jgi:hypothetical protein